MDEYLNPEQKEELRSLFEKTLQEDILTYGDMVAIIDIFLEALKRSKAALRENMMIALLSDDESEDAAE